MKKFKLLLVALLAVVVTTACSSAPKEEAVNDEGKLQAAHEAVKSALGENYLPAMAVEAQQLEEIFGVKAADVKQFIAEMPMISMHPDIFIGIEAVDGKADEVEAALVKYQEYLINDSMQYPSNLAKVKATEVIKIRNHVFLVMVGAINENMDATEAEAETFAKEENKKAVDAIKATFGE
ncbi:MAG: DUF4358 domain-containing protein [Turicibacter sp.]